MIRPSFRIPIWAVLALPAAAYLVRSLIRGDFTPQLPDDAIVLVVVVGAAAMGAYLRAQAARDGVDDDSDQEQRHEDSAR